ncbi:2-dehydropantoate 2-reductase [Motilibacter peucedani]|uniref:2-dehydropantoate 2-reductase n=1 Tax=Motilibacter peucedani TaxID=598650 RepID=A0A420XVE4_9ACTN|nr:2-dehydropantoate 2-reductase [Motilibacter peucedani]
MVGAGAVGGTIGGRLHQSGADVLLVARGEHAAVMRRDGLRLVRPGADDVLAVAVETEVARLRLAPDDVVLLAVKSQDTPGVLADLVRAGLAPDQPVVCAQNGVSNELLALRVTSRVHGVRVWLPASSPRPGVVVAQGAPMSGNLDLGRFPSGTDATSEAVAADLERSGFVARPDPDVMRWKRGKLLANLGNGVEALCGPEADASDLLAAAREEARRCFAAAGLDWPSREEEVARRGDQVELVDLPDWPRGGGSTWQSVTKGATSTEVDHLNGEVVLLGRLHDVPTPVNAAVQALVHDLVRRGGRPGDVTVDDVRRSAQTLRKL